MPSNALSKAATSYPAFLVRLLAAACVTLAGCGGPALLKEAPPIGSPEPLAEGRDGRIHASIDTVILPNGPGAWTHDAKWHEYRIRIRSLSDEPVEIREVAIFDALEHRIEARSDRGQLVDGTRETERAVKLVANHGVNRGIGGDPVLLVRSFANPVAGLIGIAVALPIVGIAHLVENEVKTAQDNREIQRRRTTLPVALPSGAEANVDLFFPITPLSGRTQVVYVDRHGEHRLDIDTRQALAELEPRLVSRVDPEFPNEARRAGVRSGYVLAHLTLDRQGHVLDVNVIHSMPRIVFDQEARRTLGLWTYSEGRHGGRIVEATLEFKR